MQYSLVCQPAIPCSSHWRPKKTPELRLWPATEKATSPEDDVNLQDAEPQIWWNVWVYYILKNNHHLCHLHLQQCKQWGRTLRESELVMPLWIWYIHNKNAFEAQDINDNKNLGRWKDQASSMWSYEAEQTEDKSCTYLTCVIRVRKTNLDPIVEHWTQTGSFI